VATRVGGLPEVVEDQKTGLLVDPDDEEDVSAETRPRKS
jgi:glycosyltransferase involved in cell wall biosynthesis